jgi:hypothetical protein
MKSKLLAVLITALFATPIAYAQGTTAPKDSGTTKDRPAASGSKGDAMKSDKGTAASAKGQAKSDAAKSDTKESKKKGDGKSPDSVITGKIKTGFIKDKIVRSRNYNVDTKDGVVTVKGKARTQAELDRALEIAKSTSGVKDVKNEVQLMASAGSKAGAAKSDGKSGTSSSSKSGTSASSAPKGDAKKDTSATTTSKGSATTK